jgi:glutathione S-transferase
MIDVYFWPTGNGKKGTMMPAECGLPYNVIPVSQYAVLQWVYWQVGGLGPMAGQAHHFLRYS